MGTIYKRGRIWYIDFRVNGRRIRTKVGRSKEVAELALKDAEVKVARKEFGFLQSEMAIDAFLDMYMEYSRANHSAETIRRYGSVVDNFREFLQDHPNMVRLSDVTPELIDKYKAYRRTVAKTRTINFELNTLRTIFYLAVKWDYLKSNPVVGVKKLKVTDSKPIRVLTPEECDLILAHASDALKPIFQTFLLTGMRKGELENLEWADVDFRRRKIKIQRKPFWQPKTGEREIPIGSQLLPILRRLKAANSKGLKSRFVFPHRDGGRIKTKLREALIKVANEAGVKDLTKVHDLRHTFASQLVMNGVDLPTVKQIMGHADIQTTMIYAHLAPDHLADAVDQVKIKA